MDMNVKQKFSVLWKKYFDNAELPIIFYYTNEEGHADYVKPGSMSRCVINALSDVRDGKALCFDANSIACFGGKRYLGFTEEVMPDFEYFLSCGILGKLDGERYKKTPQLVKEMIKHSVTFKAPARFIVFKRWELLKESDEPEVVIFFAEPDVVSGLFTLANFEDSEPNRVFTPFGSGCATIVQYPYLERGSDRPRSVIGMFDVSARPFVPEKTITFSVPMNRFVRMVDDMDDSFLITDSWQRVRKRISSSG
jgi:uncharacterized protein (DUF169 family)